MKQTRAITWLASLSMALISGCGGGGGGGGTDGGSTGNVGIASGLSSGTAQGYAADGSSTPLRTATALDQAAALLDAALPAVGSSNGAAADDRAHALAVTALDARLALTIPCPSGGKLSLMLSGGTNQQLINGRLDAGEHYEVAFAACSGLGNAGTLDGQLSLSVTASTASSSDLTLTATALTLTSAQGRTVLDGSARSQRSTSTPAAGGQVATNRLTATALALSSSMGGGQSSYQLKNMDWTVARTTSASGALLSNTQQGTLELAVSTPQRPAASLSVATLGSVSVGSDGQTTSGSFSITTGNDKLGVSYAGDSVGITLDQGNNGSIDQSWTLTRGSFLALSN